MGYSNDHYNYQVAVIFAILLGALILLGLVFGAIYAVTKSMRGDDGKKKFRTPDRAESQWPSNASNAPAYRPASAQMYQPPQQQNQSYDFSPPVAASPAMNNQAQYNPVPYSQAQQQYNQAPLVTPMDQGYRGDSRMQQIQPDVIYTQGPAGYVRSTPVEYTQTPSYHQSSV